MMVREKNFEPWTDDELDYLDRIGKNIIKIDESDLKSDHTDTEVEDWSTEVDILDLETVEYLED
jgi:hypothetical protein